MNKARHLCPECNGHALKGDYVGDKEEEDSMKEMIAFLLKEAIESLGDDE